MKEYKMETGAYEAPRVEVIEVQVEKGFAASVNAIDDAFSGSHDGFNRP